MRATAKTGDDRMATVVRKYGGTSIDGSDRILDIARRISALREQGDDVVVVVSAPGKMTDSLLAQAGALSEDPAQRELDMLMTAGERISMSLLAIALNSIGCPAVSFTGSQVGIITDTTHTDARILEVKPDRVVSELAAGNVVVVGGFQGVSTSKNVTTLGRGGSDTTAVALAAALRAERCEILSDVDGVYTADPNVVDGARRISEISYDDMCELAAFGATVLKEEAVRFAERHSIALNVRESTSETGGTIVLKNPGGPCPPVTGLSLLKDVDLVFGERLDVSGCDARDPSAERVHMIAALDRTVVLAVDRSAPGAHRECWVGQTGKTVPADLICAAGPLAGNAETATAAAAVVAALGEPVLAMVSEGRSTVLAVRPGCSDEILARLHEALLQTGG